jgi:glycosyltransferase involved in cell wall biosynthesis
MADRRGRVLHVIEATVGGTKRHLYDLVTGLRAIDWNVEVACPRMRQEAYGDVSLWEDLAAVGVPMHHVPMRRAALCRTNAAAVLRLRTLINKGDYVIVHAHSSVAGAVARTTALLMPRPPRVVYTPHGFAFLRPGSTFRRQLYLAIERALGCRTDRLIAVSATEAEVAATHGITRTSRVVTIANGIAGDRIATACNPGLRQREGWNGAPIVGTVGRLTPQKDPLTWLRVAARVAEIHADVRFIWIGGGELEDTVRRAAQRLGLQDALRLIPYRGDARELIATFDVFLLTSVFEGLPYVVIEALVSEVPVVATAVVGVRDIIRHRETGLLAAAGDTAGLAAHVLRLLVERDEARRLAETGRRDVLERFSVTRMVESTAKLYESLLAGASSASAA